MPSSRIQVVHLLLRISVAFAFLYPPITALIEPYTWLGYIPDLFRLGTDGVVILHLFGIVEVLLALWILSGWRIVYPSLAAAAMLLAIVVFNPAEFPIVFRDISIALVALVLVLWPKAENIAKE